MKCKSCDLNFFLLPGPMDNPWHEVALFHNLSTYIIIDTNACMYLCTCVHMYMNVSYILYITPHLIKLVYFGLFSVQAK